MYQVSSGDSLFRSLVRCRPPWVEILVLSSLGEDWKPIASWRTEMKIWNHRRQRTALIGTIAAIVVVVIAGMTVIAPWAPAAHITCGRGTQISQETMWVPVSLLNAPYGGSASVTATLPGNMFGNPQAPNIVGQSDLLNGSIWGAFFKVNLTVYLTGNVTVWGPGSNNRCLQPFQVVAGSSGDFFQGALFLWSGAPLFGPNSTSDIHEPEVLNFSAAPGDSSTIFWNGFYSADSLSVSTCGAGAALSLAQSNFLNVGVPVRWNAQQFTVTVSLPIVQDFTYRFPANFGTWQIDNLSAPGGPGGGWAFAYSPCP